MTPFILEYLVDPVSKKPLQLRKAEYDNLGNILSGELVSPEGSIYPITNGIPRFVQDLNLKKTVESFGNEWNQFNFIDFKINWLTHTVANTFGSTEAFKDKIIVDAGGGSGSQTLWMLQSGAKHLIMLELSHSVDDVVKRNLQPSGFTNYDIIQCSIDMPPIREQSINGIVICHNVIQHTPSVEKTATALYSIVAKGGEFVFNCYRLNNKGLLRWFRQYFIDDPIRFVLSHSPFWIIHLYSRFFGILRLIPLVGSILDKANFCVQGDVPKIEGESFLQRLKRRYKSTVLNTFDSFGSHSYQHLKSDEEIQLLVDTLQPDRSKVLNTERYFLWPNPIGIALRLFR